MAVRVRMWAVAAAACGLAACSSTSSPVCQCPTPVAYSDATIKQITAALRALPPGNVLQRAMDDYEDERDKLRICLAGGRWH